MNVNEYKDMALDWRIKLNQELMADWILFQNSSLLTAFFFYLKEYEGLMQWDLYKFEF